MKGLNVSLEKNIVAYWIGIFVISVCLLISILLLHIHLHKEHKALRLEAELVRLGSIIRLASDDLTSAVRRFVVTAKPRYVYEYWHEVDINRSRDRAIKRVKEINVPSNELELIERAKKNSDELVDTEVRAMKLVLVAYGVPEESMHPAIKNYKLSLADHELSDSQKMQLGRKIMFDDNYDVAKRKVIQHIEQFQGVMKKRVSAATKRATNRTQQILIATSILASILTIMVLCLVWLRILTIYGGSSNKPN